MSAVSSSFTLRPASEPSPLPENSQSYNSRPTNLHGSESLASTVTKISKEYPGDLRQTQGSGSGQPADGPRAGDADVDEFGLTIQVSAIHPQTVSNFSESLEIFHEAVDDLPPKNELKSDEQQYQSPDDGKPSTIQFSEEKEEAALPPLNDELESVHPGVKASEAGEVDTAPAKEIGNSHIHEGGLVLDPPDVEAQHGCGSLSEQNRLQERSSLEGEASLPKDAGTKDFPAKTHSHARHSSVRASEWSHQRLTEEQNFDDEGSEAEWQDMPALGEFDVYDDYGRLVAHGSKQDDEGAVYRGLGGAGKGYTRVQLDDDVQSVTSMDEDTGYLFKEGRANSMTFEEELRDPLSQLQATKDLLTEGQRIAYVGVTRLAMYEMTKELEDITPSKASKKSFQDALDSMKKWGQGIMVRLYNHMDIDTAEQLMIEQLAEHGVQPADLVRPLMQNARVRNPMTGDQNSPSEQAFYAASPRAKDDSVSIFSADTENSSELPSPPPPYREHSDEDVPEVQTPSHLPKSKNIDIDLRWTVLCDLFLVLIADSSYDCRSRCLLERVGKAMDVSWVQICRFEKRVIDALEMEHAADKETWDEAANMENRRKMALKQKYMIMGLATVGGGLVIGLSAGLLAPVIGAGLAAGFTTIGVSGTGAFLGGAGGTALIASGATLTGGSMGMKASNRRTGAVKTFEYRPLHNNKRVNLIVTISGWMNGQLDDVRLPFSTVDPIMGDLYSVFWEPEMLQSMGSTINILATEVNAQPLTSDTKLTPLLRP